jgi:hypothetical protein
MVDAHAVGSGGRERRSDDELARLIVRSGGRASMTTGAPGTGVPAAVETSTVRATGEPAIGVDAGVTCTLRGFATNGDLGCDREALRHRLHDQW